MSTFTASLYNPFLVNVVSPSSKEVSNQLKEIGKSRAIRTIMYGVKALVLPQILEIKEQCRFDDWDGYGASRVTSQTIGAASRFLDCLPEGLLTPDATPEATGAISFSWQTAEGLCFSVSVEQEEIYYAGLLAQEKIHGEISAFSHSKLEKIINILCENFLDR